MTPFTLSVKISFLWSDCVWPHDSWRHKASQHTTTLWAEIRSQASTQQHDFATFEHMVVAVVTGCTGCVIFAREQCQKNDVMWWTVSGSQCGHMVIPSLNMWSNAVRMQFDHWTLTLLPDAKGGQRNTGIQVFGCHRIFLTLEHTFSGFCFK